VEHFIINGLNVNYFVDDKTIYAIDNIDFEIKKGEVVAFVGESGSGKSTLANAIIGVLPSNSHMSYTKLEMDNTCVSQNIKVLRKSKIALIPQDPFTSLNPLHTIGKQMVERVISSREVNKKQAIEIAIELLKKCGIQDARERFNSVPSELSGGMLQRVLIAMAMSSFPELIIADEITTALDTTVQAQILSLLFELKKNSDVSIILITHDLGIVAHFADKVNVMYSGVIVESGIKSEIISNPRHPYTVGLIGCIPGIDKKEEKLNIIDGFVKTVTLRKSGCHYAPRCKHAMEKCFLEDPKISLIRNSKVRCFLYE
jgi:peptide/nickel transport system ATP-binding protein